MGETFEHLEEAMDVLQYKQRVARQVCSQCSFCHWFDGLGLAPRTLSSFPGTGFQGFASRAVIPAPSGSSFPGQGFLSWASNGAPDTVRKWGAEQ